MEDGVKKKFINILEKQRFILDDLEAIEESMAEKAGKMFIVRMDLDMPLGLALETAPEKGKTFSEFIADTKKRVIESMQEIVELEIHYAKKN